MTLGDVFDEPQHVTYWTIATKSAKRYFDLDAVRTEHQTGDHHFRYPPSDYVKDDGGKSTHRAGGGFSAGINPAGAPPLDWHLDTTLDPDPPSESDNPVTLEYRIGDVFDRLREIPDGSIDLIVTSPPFLALRSYLPADHPDKHKEIGIEPTPAEFLDTLYALTAEWGRVLAPHGSICVELGDTYSGSGGAGGDYNPGGLRDGQDKFDGSSKRSGNQRNDKQEMAAQGIIGKTSGELAKMHGGWPLAKSLTGIPTLYPWGLAYGRNLLTGQPHDAGQWRIRNLIVWARPNPPVGALGDKFRPATSYITVACKGQRRYFDLDAVRTEHKEDPTRARNGMKAASNPARNDSDDGYGGNPAGAPPLDWHADDHPEDGDWLWKLSTQPYRGSHYACVDDQTEALTPKGWKRHDDLRDGDLIATWSADTETWRFEPATFHRYDYDGELVAIDKRVTNQRLTPNHRVVYSTRKDPTWRIRRADSLTAGCRLPVAAAMDDGGVGPGEKAAAIAGWFCTEGGFRNGWPVIHQSGTANPDKVDAIRSLLDGIGATYRELDRVRQFHGKPYREIIFEIRGALAEWLRQFHKNLAPSTVFGWSATDARALFDAMVDGDGHRRPDGRMSFVQKAKPVAEAFQMLAVRLGYRTTMSERPDGQWIVYVSPGRTIDLRRGAGGSGTPTSLEHYTGTVWCPSVSTGMWLARRNGQPFVTGNTFPLTLPKRLIEAMCPLKVCTVCGKPSERVVDAQSFADGVPTDGKTMGRSARHEGRSMADVERTRATFSRTCTTLGWTDCGHDAWRTGIVLDPFAGSGTTLDAAQAVGRHALGIDLDSRNADLARERVGMFLNVEEGAA